MGTHTKNRAGTRQLKFTLNEHITMQERWLVPHDRILGVPSPKEHRVKRGEGEKKKKKQRRTMAERNVVLSREMDISVIFLRPKL